MILLDLVPMTFLIPVLAKVKKGVVAHRLATEHAVQNFQFGDTLAINVLFDPTKLGIFQHILFEITWGRNPTVALA